MSASAAPTAESVLAALAMVHGDTATHQQRQQAQQYCEQVKSNPQLCMSVSLGLLAMPAASLPPHSIATSRHFALHAIQHVIANNWPAINEEEKKYIKTQAIGMVENCGSISGGVGFLKQTIARILTDIALREWPQRWPDLTDTLFRIARTSGDGTEMVSLIFRNLAEEMTSSDPVLPDQRRKEVQSSLMILLDQIVPYLTSGIRDCVKSLASDRTKLPQAKAHIEAAHALLDWLPAKHVFESGLVSELCSSLTHPDLFELTCESLSSIVARKSNTIDDIYQQQILATCDATLNWCCNLMNTTSFHKQNDFLLRLVNIVSNLVSKGHVAILVPGAKIPQVLGTIDLLPLRQKLLATLGQLFSFSYQKVSVVALDIWIDLFRHFGKMLDVPERQTILSELLKLTCFRLMKLADIEWEDQDFESLEEYNTFFSNFRGCLLHLLQLLVEQEPNLCFQVARMRYEQLLNLPPPTDHLNSDRWVSTRTSRFLELEAVGSLLECIFRAVKEEKIRSDTNLKETIEGLLKLILNWTTEDPLLQTRRAHCLSMFGPILSIASSGCFQATIQALVAGVSFRPNMYASLPYANLSEDLKACRRRSISSLISLARRQDLVRNFFLPLFPQLVQTILQLLAEKRIAQVEKITLFEFLVLISQSLPPSEQAVFLKNILEEPLTTWTSSQLTTMLEYTGSTNLPTFVQLIGFNPEDQQTLVNPTTIPPTHRTQSREMRSQIRFTLHTFMAVFKPLFAGSTPTSTTAIAPNQKPISDAAANAATNLLPLILPNVVRLLGHIYALRSDRMRAILPPAMVGLLTPTADLLLNPNASTMSTVSIPPPKHYHLVWDVRRWMDRVLDSAMTLLMLAAKSGTIFYETLAQPNMQALYISCLYSNLEHMHLRDMRMLIDKFIESMFNLCPPHLYSGVFIGQSDQGQPCNTLSSILTVLRRRVQQGWDRFGGIKSGSDGSAAELSNEIHDENELRELSRCISENISKTIELQYVSLHAQHLAAGLAEPAITGTGRDAEREKERREKERRQQEANLLMQAPFCQFIFTQPAVLSSLIGLEIFLLGCSDSTSSVRAIRLLHRLLPVAVGSRVPLAVQLYGQVFQAGIDLLITGKQQLLDAVEGELTAMLKDIYTALIIGTLNEAPRQSLLALPGVDPTQLGSLETILNTVCAEKKHRSAMRAFLDRAIKQVRLNAQKSVLNSAGGQQAAQLTNPLDLLQSNANAHTSGRVGQIDNLATPLVLPQRPTNTAPVDVTGVGNLFG